MTEEGTDRFSPPAEFQAHARVQSHAQYMEMYRASLEDPEQFWKSQLSDVVFDKPWTTFAEWNEPDAKFFVGAELNITKTLLDRHLHTEARNRAALIWEGEPGETRTLTYFELHREVVRMAAALADLGVQKGDRVAIYMGMSPEIVIAMLACARLGAPHSVVFGGFSAESLRERIVDLGAKLLITQDGSYRRGNVVPLKAVADEALEHAPSVTKVVVAHRLKDRPLDLKPGRDVSWDDLMARTHSPKSIERAVNPESFDAEHPLYVLYTSGSTGKPKGLVHTTAGYLAGVHVTTKYTFDLRPSDLYWCTADVGWVTGHSYLVYGPLSVGASCLMYEGAPNAPDWGRFWSIIERHGVTILYTAPTAIRAFIRAGDEWPARYDLSSLRLLGSVGEPINPEAWRWYHRTIGGGRCPVIDTWWQTETGSIMMTTLPGACAAKPGSTGLPTFGVEPGLVNEEGALIEGAGTGRLVVKRPWPAMARTIYGNPDRYRAGYWEVIKHMYFTGDGARRDEDGYFWISGRVDDVLNVSGHRIGTAEVESALVGHPKVAEAAAVGKPDDLTGQALVVFVTLKSGITPEPALKEELANHVGHDIGKFAKPAQVRFADTLPKTRSGKIMRRLLKQVAAGQLETHGDTSTLEDLSVLATLQNDEG